MRLICIIAPLEERKFIQQNRNHRNSNLPAARSAPFIKQITGHCKKVRLCVANLGRCKLSVFIFLVIYPHDLVYKSRSTPNHGYVDHSLFGNVDITQQISSWTVRSEEVTTTSSPFERGILQAPD